MKRFLSAIIIVLSLGFASWGSSGCIPAAIGAGAYHSAKKKQANQEFESNFAKINTDRETHHLQPLDWCVEAYHYDHDYARKDPNCKKRIVNYEKGKTAEL